ncbi:hypothetical protein [Candidatus Poriferisodalis sp.]|uniref:hypothetical protein n=1 Tax=Candidatus Poriferisodalis sp. TaxID=3101277 RepID=UPI003B519B8F
MSDVAPLRATGDVGSEPWPRLGVLDELRRWSAFRSMRIGRGIDDLEVSHLSSDVADSARERIVLGGAQWQLLCCDGDGEVLCFRKDETPGSFVGFGTPTPSGWVGELGYSLPVGCAVRVYLDRDDTALNAVVGVLVDLGVDDPHEVAIFDFHVDGILIDWSPLLWPDPADEQPHGLPGD